MCPAVTLNTWDTRAVGALDAAMHRFARSTAQATLTTSGPSEERLPQSYPHPPRSRVVGPEHDVLRKRICRPLEKHWETYREPPRAVRRASERAGRPLGNALPSSPRHPGSAGRKRGNVPQPDGYVRECVVRCACGAESAWCDVHAGIATKGKRRSVVGPLPGEQMVNEACVGVRVARSKEGAGRGVYEARAVIGGGRIEGKGEGSVPMAGTDKDHACSVPSESMHTHGRKAGGRRGRGPAARLRSCSSA